MLTFADLAKKYENFHVPQYVISVGAPGGSLSKLSPEDFPVLSISVNQSVGPASSAQIAFACPYDYENSDFVNKKIYKTLAAGKMIEVKLGYEKPETVFVGVLGSIGTNFSPSGVTVGITCYDAKMTLFHNTSWKSFPVESKIKEVVAEVLKPCEQYVKVKVSDIEFDADTAKEHRTNWVQDFIDDYRFIMRLATLTNSSFYASGDTIYFTENIAEKAEGKIQLGWGEGLMSFSSEIDISGQVGSVEISYRDANREVNYYKYEGKGVPGEGKLPSDEGGVITGKSHEMSDVLVKTSKQAEIATKSMYMQQAMKYVTGCGSTIGIPDIEAGIGIELEGLGDKLNGMYFVNQVTHQFDAGGYLTSFTCQRAKI